MMLAVSFAEHLAELDAGSLTRLLERRPDVLTEPAPRSVAQLAQRLGDAESLSLALRLLDRDLVVAAHAIALLGRDATVKTVADLLAAPPERVEAVVERLCERSMAWRRDERIWLPDRLAAHFTAEFAEFRPVRAIAEQARLEGLKLAVGALGGSTVGLRKLELADRLEALLSDPAIVGRAIGALREPARARLDKIRRGGYYTAAWGGGAEENNALVLSGLLVQCAYSTELPRETAIAVWLTEQDMALIGPPHLLPADTPAADVSRGAQSAAEAALRGLTTLLDYARDTPLTALKKGGVGLRERTRLAKRLSLPETELVCWIDVAFAGGLLAATPRGYTATARYDRWREAEPGARWARVARAWFALEYAPLRREDSDGDDVPPPLPLLSGAGMLRRALLVAAADGASVRAAAAAVDWFCPLHSYPPERRDERTEAAVAEARLLGVIVDDAVSDLGRHLVAVATGPDSDAELARRCGELLPESRGQLVLQSDLTAVVSGQPSAAASRLLAAAATCERRGVAETWRFTPASVRAALDTGWTVDELRAELASISERELPQPLDYLLSDVARRHGSVRLRGSRCCLVGAEAEIAEITHTRSLRRLHLAQLAPTVLSSPFEVEAVLPALREAGFAPMAEDAEGMVIVEARPDRPAPDGNDPAARPPRLPAAELAARLTADPRGQRAAATPSSVDEQLAGLGRPRR